ncbi:hypothetical protein BC830DRAFT_1082749 [Chytriomyces sp. MP71]|nr:hypothetical protein BC830DRAFT_1082749 [Chytriomyces sp. MP71]
MKIWRLKRHHLASEEERESAAGGEKSASEADTDDEGHRIHAAASNSTSDDTLEGATPIKTKAPLAISTPASSTSTARMLPSPTDPDAHVCAYPDSLFLQEGTAQKYISKDYAFLRQRAVLAGGGGPMGGYIHSIKSRYRLGMTCSVGNASHKGNLIVRSNVYVFPLEALLERSIGGRVTFVLTSDGIKDLVKSHQIGQTLANLSHSLRILSGSTSGAGVTPTKRKPISACIADLITRPTLDGHDRNAREHLEDLVELFEKATEGLAGSPTKNPRAAAARQRNKELEVYTDTRVAVEALVDLAILRGATDDVTVAAFDLVCASRNPQSGTAQNDPSTESVSEEVSRSDESHEIVWDRSSQQWRFGSVLPLPGLLPVRKPLQPSAIIEKILAVVAGAQEKKIATEALNIVKPPPPFTPSKEEGLVAAQVGLSSGSGSVEDEHGKAAPFVVGFGVAALDEIFKKVDTVNGAGFFFGSGHKTGVELESDDGICMENVNGLPGLGASNMELNVSESNMDLNNDAGIEENAGYSSRKRKY